MFGIPELLIVIVVALLAFIAWKLVKNPKSQ
jgi:Sec-independent protein translocase protein TatA